MISTFLVFVSKIITHSIKVQLGYDVQGISIAILCVNLDGEKNVYHSNFRASQLLGGSRPHVKGAW